MKPGTPWRPDPELLAAYIDGEFEGREDLQDLRHRLENWLSEHPEAQLELGEYRLLRSLWNQSTPADPSPGHWRKVLNNIQAGRLVTVPQAPPWKKRLAPSALAVACGLVFLLVGLQWRTVPTANPPVVQIEEILPVAQVEEVVILSVEGRDTGSLVVGQLPVQGALELLEPGEVVVTSLQPDTQDQMIPDVRVIANQRPLIWARADFE